MEIDLELRVGLVGVVSVKVRLGILKVWVIFSASPLKTEKAFGSEVMEMNSLVSEMADLAGVYFLSKVKK